MSDEFVDLPEIHPVVLAANQVIEAIAALDKTDGLRWPYRDLDALTGPMGPGELWYAVAFSGGGKTSFVSSSIVRWQEMGKRVYVMPLELQAWRFRTYLACTRLGIHPGDALSGELRESADGQALRELIKAELTRQTHSPFVDTVMIDPQRAINIQGLEKGLMRAKAFHADVVIIDHIDHIEPTAGSSSNLYADAKAVNYAALRMAQDNDLLLVCTSQLNNATVSGQDHLARYQPPREQHVLMGGKKREVATGMIGLFRPIRERYPDESNEDYLAALKAARQGLTEPHKMLEPNAMGVNAMKLRNYGARDGQRCVLSFSNGAVSDFAERDRWTTQGNYPRKVI